MNEKYETYIGIGLQRDPRDFSRSHRGNYGEFAVLAREIPGSDSAATS